MSIKIEQKKAWMFTGLLVVCMLSIFSCPPLSFADENTNRLERLENEVDTLSRAVYKGEPPPANLVTENSGGADSANLGNRMDQLETQIRELTGKVEDQNHQIDQLKAQLEKMSGDMEVRLNEMNRNAAGASAYTAQPAEKTGPATPGSLRSDETGTDGPSTAGGGQSAASSSYPPQPAGGAYKWSSKGNAAPSGKAAEGSLGTLNAGTGTSTAADSATNAYESAFALLKNGQYDAAETAFEQFLAQYPASSLKGNAKYWLGEAFYARAQYDKAARTFAEAYQDNPKGPKAADDLLKMGMSLAGLGKKQDACVALGQVPKEFAATSGAVLRRAHEEMTKIGC